MTRDQWLEKCAERLREKAGMEPGEAAAYAITMAEVQSGSNGRNPKDWDNPKSAADDEMSYWDDDGEP